MIAARYASLVAFTQSRGFCPTGDGGGIDNSCGAKTMSAPDRDGGGGISPKPATADTWGDNTWAGEKLPESLSHLGDLKVWKPRTEVDIARLADSMGIKSPSELLTIGACNFKDAEVELDGLGSNVLTFRADVPMGKGLVKIDTAITLEPSGPEINYGYFALDDAARKEALSDPRIQTKYAGKIFDAMLASMESAEKAGFSSASTTAEGYGPGSSNGRRTDLQGYRLWGRFGFDGDIQRGWFSRAASKGVDVPSALSPEDRKELESKGSITLQQLLKTKQGERIWKQWGVPIELYFDFKDKQSIGYKRYQDMLSLSKRANNRRSFFEYVAGLELREDPSLWSGFVEERAFCPNGKGNGVTNTCGKGIGINDADQDFTGQILSGEKTMETRRPNSLKPYIGKTVGIVRTGKGKATLVGVMKVGEPKFYKTSKEFDADFDKHRVGKDSVHYIGPEGKYGYPLSEVKPVKPRILKSTGHVARVIAKKVRTRDLVVEFDLDAESPEEPNTESRGDAPAPEKDRIKGSDVNDEGSAKNKSGDISLSESTISSLKKKVEEHNAAMREAGKPDWTHVRLPSLKAVFRRGAGAFSTSHRPGMTRDQWAMARVNAFLTLARRGRPENAKYTTDNDLLHSKHPKHSKESRGFCATGEGGGIDNSCGAKTISAPDRDGGGGSSAASSVVFSSSTTAKLLDGDTIDASDEDADENVAAINWRAAEEIGRGNPELQQAVYKYSAGPHEVNGYFRYGESLDEYAENIGSTPEKLAASASATESAITTIAAAANPDGRELTSFRGLMNRRQNREYIEAIKSVSVGDVVKEAGVFSTSASLRRASMAFTSQDGGVIFRVKGKGGAPIAHVANYKDEWEVAYPNRSRFVVTSVARNVSVRISDSHRLTNVTFIDIREAD